MSDNIESRGEKLRNLRLAKGLTLEDVHKKTKVHPTVLEALEQDKTLGMNPVYLRGFLRIYCKFLGVDPQDYIKDIKKPSMEYLSRPKAKDDVPSKPPLSLSTIKPSPKAIKTAAVIIVSIIVLFVLFRAVLSFKAYIRNKPKEKVAAQSVAVKALKQPEVKAAAPISDIRLGIHAKQDCWLRVKVDGKTVFERTLKKGQSEIWQAKDKIELRIGNASGIELDLNGKILSPLGKKGQGVKRAIITKDGFEAL
jgi:cytoskeleton protein RodZ